MVKRIETLINPKKESIVSKKIKTKKIIIDSDKEEIDVGSIIEVKDSVAKYLIAEDTAELWEKEAEKVEIQEKVEEILDVEEKVESKKIKTSKKESTEDQHIEVIRNEPEYKSLGDIAQKLFRGEKKEITLKATTGLNEAVDADGGFLVEHRLVKEIFDFGMQGAVVWPKCRQFPVPEQANGLKLPFLDNAGSISRTDLPVGTFLAEGAQKTNTKFSYGQHDLGLVKLAFFVPLTDEIIEDVGFLTAWVLEHIRGKMAWQIDDAIFNLSAAASGFIGLADAGAANFVATPVAHPSPWTGSAVYDIISGVFPRFRAGSEWYMSNLTWSTIQGDIGGGTTESTVPLVDIFGLKLAGYKVNIMEQLGDGSGTIYFGNFEQGYAVARKGGVKVDMSSDFRFDFDESILRLVVRSLGAPVIREQTLVDTSVVAAFSTTS